jgi:SNF2 family DNA or RNA helicase
MSKLVFNRPTDFSLKQKDMAFQTVAFNAIKDLPYSGIFHEQGLGKTKIALDLVVYWLEKKDIDTVMIVTKKQLIQNWKDEFRKHTFLSPKVMTNNVRENYYILNSPCRSIITNFETISIEKERLKHFLHLRNVAIIIDESTKLKNPESKLSQNFFELSQEFKIRTIMTGTPIANRPYDIWAQIFFLDQGKSLGTNFREFKDETDLKNTLSNDEVERDDFESSVASIFGKIQDFCIRETKKSCCIDLPEKKYWEIWCDFEFDQKQMYQNIVEETQLLIQKNGEVILDDQDASLKRLLRLIQVASNPRLVDDSYGLISGKEKKLDQLLNEIISRGEKVIVWSSFIENVNYFCGKYKKYGSVKVHGSMNIEDRNYSVKRFKEDNYVKILFATPQSSKEGLTLTVANNVIFYDRGFNLDDYLQAQDRIHRISQTKICNVYILMIKESIDEWVNVLLEAKQNAAWLAQGDIKLSNYREIADYAYGDLIKEILKKGGNNYGEQD